MVALDWASTVERNKGAKCIPFNIKLEKMLQYIRTYHIPVFRERCRT